MIIKHRGWARHFCCADSCRFRLNTLIYAPKYYVKVVVSTVGLMYARNEEEPQTIGHQRYFETMAFHADDSEFNDALVSHEIPFASKWAINKIDGELEANEMHRKAVDKICRMIRSGEIKELKAKESNP